jgi:hypothetical protein
MSKRPDEEHQLLRPFDYAIREEKSKHIGAAVKRAEQLANELKAISAKYKLQLDDLKEVVSGLAEELKSGLHYVPMHCAWVMSTNKWELIADDGEVIRTEPTTMADRQAELSLS